MLNMEGTGEKRPAGAGAAGRDCHAGSCVKCGRSKAIAQAYLDRAVVGARVAGIEMLDPLALDILDGKLREGQTITADARDGKLTFG
jgi:hypothetical protein